MVRCPSCGASMRSGLRFCEQCARALVQTSHRQPEPEDKPAAVVRCPSCGAANRPGPRFCEQCAQPLVRESGRHPVTEAKSASTEIRCPSCGAANQPGLRFCEQCAQPLIKVPHREPLPAAVRCPSCGATNRPGLRFCEQCATPLVAAGPGAAPLPERAAIREVRRKPRRIRRLWLWAAVVVIVATLLPPLLSPVVGYVQYRLRQRPQLSSEQAVKDAAVAIEEGFPQYATASPEVGNLSLGDHGGYEMVYELPSLTRGPDGPVQYDRRVTVRVNAMTGQLVVAETQ